MKIKIAYGPSELIFATAVLSAVKQLLPTVKVKESDAHPPYKHIYIEIPKPKND